MFLGCGEELGVGEEEAHPFDSIIVFVKDLILINLVKVF